MKKIASALLLSAAISTPAFAADEGFYLGAKVGSAKKSVPGTSETSTAFGVFGGYSFNQYFAIEAGYADLGKVANDVIKFTTYDLSAVGSFPINEQFSLYGKLGLASTKEEALGVSVSRSAPTYGLGGQFNLNRSVGFRLGWDRHSFGDDVVFAKGDSDMYSLGVLFKF